MTILNFTKIVTQILQNNKIQYVIVGGCAKLIYFKNVTTSDVDILICNSTENINNFINFIEKNFKSKVDPTKVKSYDVLKIKAIPYSIDFHFKLDGVSNKSIFNNLHLHLIEQNSIQFISKNNLIKNLKKVNSKNGIHK